MLLNSLSAGSVTLATRAFVVPSFATVTVTSALIVSYVTVVSVPATSSTVYLYVPSSPRLNSSAENLTFPSASFLTVSTTLPVESLSAKLNSCSLSSRPSNFLVKLNSTCTGTLFTRFSVGLFGFSTFLVVGL